LFGGSVKRLRQIFTLFAVKPFNLRKIRVILQVIKHMKKLFFTILISAMLIPFSGQAATDPMTFFGSATLNGVPLPTGAYVYAFDGNDLVGQTGLSDDGVYGNNDPALAKLFVAEYSSSTLVFKYSLSISSAFEAGAKPVVFNHAFRSGQAVRLDLNFVSEDNQTENGSIKVLGVEYVSYADLKSLDGLSAEIANEASKRESDSILKNSPGVSLRGANKDLYELMIKQHSDLDDATKEAIAYFIGTGTPTTLRLGAGERAGALNSYISAFGRVPSSVGDWQNVIKICSGRWPSETNAASEARAKIAFKKVYLREADMKKANDNAAVTIMAYGLRPANRNLNSETTAIKTFKYIYKHAPFSASDWDAVRAVAYSGAKR
jgi:hypothetical protein